MIRKAEVSDREKKYKVLIEETDKGSVVKLIINKRIYPFEPRSKKVARMFAKSLDEAIEGLMYQYKMRMVNRQKSC